MSVLTSIALAYVTSRRRQTAVSVLGVMMGVGFYIGIASLMQGFQQYFIQKIIDVSPHITIKDEFRTPPLQPARIKFPASAVQLRGARPRDETRGIRTANRIIWALRRQKDITVAPTLQGQAFVRYGGKDTGITLVGIDPVAERRVSNLEKDLKSGSLSDLLTNPNGIILGAGVAKKSGLGQGDYTSVVSAAGVILKMKVVGIFETGIVSLDDSQAYVRLKKNQILQKRENVINQIRIRTKDVDRAGEIAQRIEKRFGYRTESWREANENIFGIFVIQNGIMYSTVGAILLVAGFGIYNIISTVVNEKRRDIAILKSIGFSEHDIRVIFVVQGVTVGVVGTCAGWLLGYGLVELLASIRFDIDGMVRTEGFVLYRTPMHYVLAGGFAIVIAAFSAYLPARKASGLNPVDIIRGAA